MRPKRSQRLNGRLRRAAAEQRTRAQVAQLRDMLVGLSAHMNANHARILTLLELANPVHPTPPRATTPMLHDKPTDRERQVAELVADGMSNRQIGTRLGISHRTAETHVLNLLGKLGFSNRAQISGWLVENRMNSAAFHTAAAAQARHRNDHRAALR